MTPLRLELLGEHDGQDRLICLGKALAHKAADILDGLLSVIEDDAVLAGGRNIRKSERGALDCSAGTGADLEGARRLGAIANHARERCQHVIDRELDLLQVATLQIGHAAARASTSRDARAAQRRQATHVLFDVDNREVGDNDCSGDLFIAGTQQPAQLYDGHGASNALVAAAGARHDRERAAAHARIASGRGRGHNAQRRVVKQGTAAAGAGAHAATHFQPITALKTFLANTGVHGDAIEDEGYLLKGNRSGELEDVFERQTRALVSLSFAHRDLSIDQHLAVALDTHHVGVIAADDDAGGIRSIGDDGLDIEDLWGRLLLDVDNAGIH